MNDQIIADVQRFFGEFERARNELDPEASAAAQFADVFLSADPNRVVAVPRDAFVKALPERAQLFASIGRTATRLTELPETKLDEKHVLVDTEWHMQLRDPTGRSDMLTLSSVFLLRRDPDGLRIVFYRNRQDIAALVKARQAERPDPA